VQDRTHRVHGGHPGPPQTDPGPWSVWGGRLLAVVSGAMALSLAWAWIQTFYRGVAVSSLLSFSSSDQPWMPIDSVARPIIGNHFFGDFQLPFAFGGNLLHSLSPYLSSSIPNSFSPLGIVFFMPFHLLSLRPAALVYLVITSAIFLVPLWLLLAPLRWENRLIFLVPVAIVTTPFASTMDRGNTIGFAMGLLAWAIWASRSERWVLCGSLLCVAIAIKGYPAAVLVVPLALRRYRFTLLVAASAVGLNLLALVLYPGGYLRNLRVAIPAMASFKLVGLTQLYSWSLYSIVPKTAGFFFGPSAANQFLAPGRLLLWLPAVIYLCAVYYVIRRAVVPQWCWGPLALASVQLIVPLSFAYSTAWAPVAAVWYAWGCLIRIDSGSRSEIDEQGWVALRVLLLLALTVTLAPSVFAITGAGGFTTPVAQYLSPVLVLATLCVAVAQSLRPRTVDSRLQPTAEAAEVALR